MTPGDGTTLRQVGLGLLVLTAAFPVRFSIGGGRTGSWFDLGCLIIVPVALAGAGTSWRRSVYPRGIIGAALLVTVLALASIGWSAEKSRTALYVISWAEAVLRAPALS